MPQNRTLTPVLPCFGVKVKGWGQGQRSGSRHESRSRSNVWCATVDIRGSALPSAQRAMAEVSIKEESLPVLGDCLCVCYQCGCSRLLI